MGKQEKVAASGKFAEAVNTGNFELFREAVAADCVDHDPAPGQEPGDSLEMESAGEAITLRPVRGTGPLVKEHGMWVFHAGQPLPASATDELLQQLREERNLDNLGTNQ
jgi:hypothetical protein